MAQEPPLQDPFELLKKMWGPMGLPLAPLLDPNDIEKRIADLKSVESWLSMNMNVLRMTIQGLEMQKATLAAFQAMQPKPSAPPQGAQPKAGAEAPPASAADAWWTLLQQVQNPPPTPKPEPKPEKKGK
ncbi:MAG: PhaM family polyhydroxyalkanoate granule multifunctional regulatory protein [Bacteroidota bacterium]|jgi:hypothetical protein